MHLRVLCFCALALILFHGCTMQYREPSSEVALNSPNNEVIYHVVQRSFYDTNGDMHGDLNGLRQKLEYLQELGVTSV